jgi:bacterial/archaeal transporter family protein
MHTWLLFSVVSLVFFGITGVTQKLSTNYISFELSFVWFCLAMIAVSIVTALLVPMNWHLSTPVVLLAALGGFLNGLGALTSFAAFAKGGKASIVTPIINLFPLVTVGGAWVFLGEKLTSTQILGIVFALLAIVFLSQETPPAPREVTAV